MKYLLIVRHAKADSNYKLKDFDRPLNEHGIKDAILMANKLIENSFSPDLIISSGANRALTTSKIVSEVLKYPINHIEVNNNIYHSSFDGVLDIIHNVSDEFNKIMIVGHNPTFHYLSQNFSDEQMYTFPTCSMCCIKFDVNSWFKVKQGEKQFMIYPKLFR